MRANSTLSRLSGWISPRRCWRAKAMTADPGITYQQCAIEEIAFPDDTFDVLISSLALHYVAHFDQVCRPVHIIKLSELAPTPVMVIAQPTLRDDRRHPTYLVIAAVKAPLL